MADEYRSFSGEIRELRKKNEFLFDVTLRMLNNAPNRNNWQFTDMKGNKDQFAGKPLLIAYEYGKVGAGHNATKKRDENGREYLSFMGATDQRIIGSLSDDPNDIWVETDENGIDWIYGRGSIWKWYAKEAADKILEDTEAGRPMSISIEALVDRMHMEGDIEVEEAYRVLGISILGDGVKPAVPGANIKALSEIESDGFKQLKLRAASYITPGESGEKEEPIADPQIKPQNKTIAKEKRATMKAFSKKQLATLSAKFPNFKLLTAGSDENGTHICMMDKEDGSVAVYTMADQNETIVPEKILHVNSQICFEFGEEKLTVDLCDVMDEAIANATSASDKIKKLEADLASAQETIKTMQTAEKVRRVKACTDKVDALVAEFNAAREEKIDCAACDPIKEAIQNGEYSECVDKEGCWNGEQMVELSVKGIMADFQMEVDKRNLSRSRNAATWENIDPSVQVNGTNGIADLIDGLREYS